MSIGVAEAALIRHRHEMGLVSPCGDEWDAHHWHEVEAPTDSERIIAVICVHCGILPLEQLEHASVEDLHDA